MRRAVAATRRLYRPQLAPGEEIQTALRATAAGTGAKVGFGALVGALLGWLYAIALDSSLLAPLVLGALAGTVVGYLQAERAARRPEGPGTIHVDLVLTTANLLTMRRYGVRRNKELRRYPLDQIKAIETKRYPVGAFHSQRITLADGTSTSFVADGALEVDPVNRESSSG